MRSRETEERTAKIIFRVFRDLQARWETKILLNPLEVREYFAFWTSIAQ